MTVNRPRDYNRPRMQHRLVVFVFYDKQGILDDYILDCVSQLQRDVGPVLFVVNGLLQEDGKRKISPFVQKILMRENVGLDAWAFKVALESVGFAELANYDEVILMNDTCFGPLRPWPQLFNKMAHRSDLDFWGLTSTTVLLSHLLQEKRICGRHIDSYFTVFRKNLLASPYFEAYWNDLPVITSYDEAIGHHERQICEFLTAKGFSWGTSYPIRDGYDHVFFSPYGLIAKQHCPLLKRRCFTHPDHLEYLRQGREGSVYSTLSYIEDNLEYDSGLIWQHILRFASEEVVLRNLGVENPFSVPLSEQPELKLSMLPRVRTQLSNKEKIVLFKWKLSKGIKKLVKMLFYPVLKKHIDTQKKW